MREDKGLDSKLEALLTPAIIALLAIVAVACNGPTPDSYFDAKAKYAASLDRHVGGENPNFRIVAINGPMYPAGQLLFPGSAEPISSACIVPEEQLQPTDWAKLPTLSSENRFVLEAGLPSLVAQAVKQVTDLNASVKAGNEAFVSFTETTQRTLQRDDFEDHLNAKSCIIARLRGDLTVVRGIVDAKEKITSERSFEAGLNAKVFTTDFAKVEIASDRSYAVEDSERTPRFYIVTNLLPPSIPGLSENATSAEIDRKVSNYLRAEAKTPVREAQPSDETIRNMGGKVPQ